MNYRKVAAYGLAIATFVAAVRLTSLIERQVGIPAFLAYSDYSETSSGSFTMFGLAACLLAILASVAVWYIAADKPFTANERANWLGWLAGTLLAAMAGIVLWKLMHRGRGTFEPLWYVLELGLWGLAWMFGRTIANWLRAPR
jgi:hypothetical protein